MSLPELRSRPEPQDPAAEAAGTGRARSEAGSSIRTRSPTATPSSPSTRSSTAASTQ